MKSSVAVPSKTAGDVIVLNEPLSFWGGFDAETGHIIDEHHPQVGRKLTDMVVVMPAGRGSSSASSVIAEAARLSTAPAALVMLEADEIITIGSIVADELYGRPLAVLVVSASDYEHFANGQHAVIDADGTITIE